MLLCTHGGTKRGERWGWFGSKDGEEKIVSSSIAVACGLGGRALPSEKTTSRELSSFSKAYHHDSNTLPMPRI